MIGQKNTTILYMLCKKNFDIRAEASNKYCNSVKHLAQKTQTDMENLSFVDHFAR